MALRRKIVDLVWLDLLDDADQTARIRHVAMMQKETHIFLVPIAIQMIDAVSVEQRCAPLQAVDFITLLQQQFRQIGTILPGNTGNQCFFSHPLLNQLSKTPSCQRRLFYAQCQGHFCSHIQASATIVYKSAKRDCQSSTLPARQARIGHQFRRGIHERYLSPRYPAGGFNHLLPATTTRCPAASRCCTMCETM